MVAGIGALLGGVGSIVSGFMGASAAEEANEQNWKINLLNYYARQQEREDRIQQSRQNRADQRLGSTDASGNRVRFVEGKGWVTELSEDSDRMQDLQRKEQENVLQRDLPKRRQQMERNLERQRDEDYVAEGFLSELRNLQREDPERIEGLLRNASTRGINEAHDAASSPLLRTALRTGASNVDKIVEGVARSRSDALQKAFEDAQLKALDVVDQRYNAGRANAAQMYNTFAERAGRMPEVSYAPQNPSGIASAMLSQLTSAGDRTGSELAAAFGANGGSVDYTQPNYGMANAIGTAGQAISGMANNWQQQQNYEDSLAATFARYGLKDRQRRSQGVF